MLKDAVSARCGVALLGEAPNKVCMHGVRGDVSAPGCTPTLDRQGRAGQNRCPSRCVAAGCELLLSGLSLVVFLLAGVV